jgi:hypothetical protein
MATKTWATCREDAIGFGVVIALLARAVLRDVCSCDALVHGVQGESA